MNCYECIADEAYFEGRNTCFEVCPWSFEVRSFERHLSGSLSFRGIAGWVHCSFVSSIVFVSSISFVSSIGFEGSFGVVSSILRAVFPRRSVVFAFDQILVAAATILVLADNP